MFLPLPEVGVGREVERRARPILVDPPIIPEALPALA